MYYSYKWNHPVLLPATIFSHGLKHVLYMLVNSFGWNLLPHLHGGANVKLCWIRIFLNFKQHVNSCHMFLAIIIYAFLDAYRSIKHGHLKCYESLLQATQNGAIFKMYHVHIFATQAIPHTYFVQSKLYSWITVVIATHYCGINKVEILNNHQLCKFFW